jgi:hypothetical protein
MRARKADNLSDEINRFFNFRLKMFVRPKHVVDNLNKIVKNY